MKIESSFFEYMVEKAQKKEELWLVKNIIWGLWCVKQQDTCQHSFTHKMKGFYDNFNIISPFTTFADMSSPTILCENYLKSVHRWKVSVLAEPKAERGEASKFSLFCYPLPSTRLIFINFDHN